MPISPFKVGAILIDNTSTIERDDIPMKVLVLDFEPISMTYKVYIIDCWYYKHKGKIEKWSYFNVIDEHWTKIKQLDAKTVKTLYSL